MARPTAGFFPNPVYPGSITLDRYQELLGLPMAAFNGLNKPDDERRYACATIWRQSTRDDLAKYLVAAETMREQELGYFLGPKYIQDDDYDVKFPIILAHKLLIKMGKETTTLIQSGVALTLSAGGVINDLVVITVATTVTDVSEIMICYPGESEVIHPSSIVITGGNAVISIPRSRLVKPALNDDRDDPLDYDDDGNFLGTVDVYRHYADIAQAVAYGYYDSSFVFQSSSMYPMIKDKRLSIVVPQFASFSGGVPTASCSLANVCGASEAIIRTAYLSGLRYTIKAENETCRLAHTLMPYEPCTCEPVHQYWVNDTAVVLNTFTPYGNTVGAVNAWVNDSRSKIGFGGTFPGMR